MIARVLLRESSFRLNLPAECLAPEPKQLGYQQVAVNARLSILYTPKTLTQQ
jgi:hypothetical protein